MLHDTIMPEKSTEIQEHDKIVIMVMKPALEDLNRSASNTPQLSFTHIQTWYSPMLPYMEGAMLLAMTS